MSDRASAPALQPFDLTSRFAFADRSPGLIGFIDRYAPLGLYVAFLIYVFVGVSPLSDASSAVLVAGNDMERTVLVLLAAVACVLIAMRARTALNVVRRTWAVWLLIGWFCASVSWADYPDLSLRRSVVWVMLAIICLASACGIGSLRRAHAALVAVLAFVILADLAVSVVRPDFALTDDGVRGFHAQKNVAGLVGMIAVIAALGWTIGTAGLRRRLAGIGLVALSGYFLMTTGSKTSISLTVVAAVAIPAILGLRRAGSAVAMMIGGFVVAAVLVVVAIAAAFDVSLLALLTPGGDVTFTGRAQIWDFVRSEIARKPWTGFGYGSFWDVGLENNPLLRAPPGSWLSQLKTGPDSTFLINEAHNGYLDLQLQAGLPALVLAVFIAVQAAWRLLKQSFARDSSFGSTMASITFLLIMFAFLAHNFTESSLWIRGQILAHLSLLVTILASQPGNPSTDEDWDNEAA